MVFQKPTTERPFVLYFPNLNLISDLPWCVLGDFNKILTHDEKLGGKRRPHKQMTEFRVALQKNGLFDLGWINHKYTWSNRH